MWDDPQCSDSYVHTGAESRVGAGGTVATQIQTLGRMRRTHGRQRENGQGLHNKFQD